MSEQKFKAKSYFDKEFRYKINHKQLINNDSFLSHYERKNTVFIYILNITDFEEKLEYFWKILSKEEQIKAEQYYTKSTINRYIISRGILKHIISHHTTLSLLDIDLIYNSYGKPLLKDNVIKFNLSHSHDKIIYAISLEHEIGIDIEYDDQSLNIYELSDLVFTSLEYQCFIKLNYKEKIKFFYKIWTKKEALTKAIGVGLSYPINSLEVMNNEAISFIYNNAKILLYCYELMLDENYYSAIAIEEKIHNIVYIKLY